MVGRRHEARPRRAPDTVTATAETKQSDGLRFADMLDLLRCPETGARLELCDGRLVTPSRNRSYALSPAGIPLFGGESASAEARSQQVHYDVIA